MLFHLESARRLANVAGTFVGMFGLRAKGGIDKPGYYAYGLLHQLGSQRLPNLSIDVIVTRTLDGGLAIAAWNWMDPDRHGSTTTLDLDFAHVPANARVTILRVESDHGNVLKEYAAMGSPLDPIPAQVDELNRETALRAASNQSRNLTSPALQALVPHRRNLEIR